MNDSVFILKLASLSVAVWPCAPYFDRFAAKYGAASCDARAISECDLRIAVTPEMIARERELSDSPDYSDAYLQTLAVYRCIAEQAPAFNRLLMHAAVVGYGGKAYAFVAPSGTGKSTHVRLWRKALGEAVTVINGDKPLLHITSNQQGGVVAYGTPWCGKEGWNANTHAPLAGICLIQRGETNTCTLVNASDSLDWLLRQVYMPANAQAALKTLELADALLREVPTYKLMCDMSANAVKASFEIMTGLPFSQYEVLSGCHE